MRVPGEAAEGAREAEPTSEAGGGGSDGGQHDFEGGVGKLLSPERRRRCVVQVRQRLRERKEGVPSAGWHAAQRRIPKRREDEEALRQDG